MVATVAMVEPKEKFSNFPSEIENFFLGKEFEIKLYPQEIYSDQEYGSVTLVITSASQYYNYLNEELEFWQQNDPSNRLETIVYQNRFKNAKSQFDNALNYKHSPSSMESYLKQSLTALVPGALSSKAKLAKMLLKLKEKSSQFIAGFKAGVAINNTAGVSTNSDTLQGFYAAMVYRGVFDNYAMLADEDAKIFKANVEEAAKNFATLNENYTRAFIEQQQRLELFAKETNDYLDDTRNQKETFFDSARQRMENLELLYGEKLKLSEPAEYWEKIDVDYRKKGTKWLVISGALALIIVVGLIIFLLIAPAIFSDDYHWFDNLKNSAIITVIASVAIYMLRLTVKMATSSYHLSRDAKERKNLSYFYLALIEKGAVSDKERALILNSLFSRSDTGLLKGEAAPSMPTNVSDIVEFLKSK